MTPTVGVVNRHKVSIATESLSIKGTNILSCTPYIRWSYKPCSPSHKRWGWLMDPRISWGRRRGRGGGRRRASVIGPHDSPVIPSQAGMTPGHFLLGQNDPQSFYPRILVLGINDSPWDKMTPLQDVMVASGSALGSSMVAKVSIFATCKIAFKSWCLY